MKSETANIKQFQIPQENPYDERDQEEYRKGLDDLDSGFEADFEPYEKEVTYNGEQIQPTAIAERRMAKFDKKQKIGGSILRFAISLGKTA